MPAVSVHAAVAAAGLLISAAAAPAATLFDCTLQEAVGGGGWIDPNISVSYDDANGTAMVYDGVIDYFVGKPIEAKVAADTKKRMTFSWKVKTENRGQSATMNYRLSIMKADNSAHLVAIPLGYANTWQMSGACKRRAG